MNIFQQNQDDGGGWKQNGAYNNDNENFTAIDETCEFPTQKIWILTWLGLNIVAIIG